MAFGNDPRRVQPATTAGPIERIDEGLRSYMLQVYNYMGMGLALSGLVAYLSFTFGISQAVAQTPLVWLFILAPFGLVMLLGFRIQKMSVPAAQLTFWAYAALMGVWLSLILAMFTGESVARVFFITAATFGAMSLYGYTTSRDLSGWGSFLFMGLIGVILAIVVNFFLQSPALYFAVSVIGVLVFVGLTAYDTQRIKEMYYELDGADVAARKQIMGALSLYLNFINMFIMLMHLFGERE
jgi:uncharacterized protein